MTTTEHTDKRDRWPSRYQHCMGYRCYTSDTDEMNFQLGSMEEVFMGFDSTNQVRFAIDYKRVSLFTVNEQRLSDQHWSVKSQAAFWDNQVKTPIPFFVVLTYLSEEFVHKMYFVLPANNAAKQLFTHYNKDLNGEWMTLLKFSQFQHLLRDISWNPEEVLDNKNTQLVGLPDDLKLNQLPNQKHTYPLPQLDFQMELTDYAKA